MADGANARKITYKYDVGGRQNGMSVDTVHYTSFRGRSSATGDGKTHFVYNENDNRVKLTTVYGNEYYFVYDPTASIPAMVYEEGPNYRYVNVREPDGGLISLEKWRNGSRLNAYTYHFDGLGSTVALTDAYGAITDRYSYDEWGNVTHTALAGSVSDNPYQYVGRYGYYTHYQEPNFKLLQLGVRFYDPQIGRFISRDSTPAQGNEYCYVDNSPTGWVDYTGRSKSKPQPRKGDIPPDIPWFKGGWDWIDDAVSQPACKKCLEHLSFEMLRRFVRCIIWSESTDGRDPLGPEVKCMGHFERARGLMQLMPHGVGSSCVGWRYPGWSANQGVNKDNVMCGTKALCDILERRNYDIHDSRVISMYNGIDTPKYKACMNSMP